MHGAGDDVFFRNVRVKCARAERGRGRRRRRGRCPRRCRWQWTRPSSLGTFAPSVGPDLRGHQRGRHVTSTAGGAALSVSPQPAYLANGDVHALGAAAGRALQGGVDGARVQRRGGDHVPSAHRRDAGASHRQLQQDARRSRSRRRTHKAPRCRPPPRAAAAGVSECPGTTRGVRDARPFGVAVLWRAGRVCVLGACRDPCHRRSPPAARSACTAPAGAAPRCRRCWARPG